MPCIFSFPFFIPFSLLYFIHDSQTHNTQKYIFLYVPNQCTYSSSRWIYFSSAAFCFYSFLAKYKKCYCMVIFLWYSFESYSFQWFFSYHLLWLCLSRKISYLLFKLNTICRGLHCTSDIFVVICFDILCIIQKERERATVVAISFVDFSYLVFFLLWDL